MKEITFHESEGVLKTAPEVNSLQETYYPRVDSNYKDLSSKFRNSKKDFSKQYCLVYLARLEKMKQVLHQRVIAKWGNVPIKKLVQLQDAVGEKCVIMGTLFKHQELKPNIYKEISHELQLIPQQKVTKFVSDTDELILEDEIQRIKLRGLIDVQKIVTGVVCGVLGVEDESGKFNVEDVCWPTPSPITRQPNQIADDRYLVLLSGLDLSKSDGLSEARLFCDWVTGWIGEPHEQQGVSTIVKVIIAGNSLRGSSPDKEGRVIGTSVESSSDIVSSVRLADDFLSNLSESVEVDLMPGEFDPTNFSLPQQPMHFSMFPKATRFKSLNGVTNPYCAEVGGRHIAGSSGQPVDDVLRYCTLETPLQALNSTLNWGHLAPTAPDTLCCYPLYDGDPLVMDFQPDVYFVGNQDKFDTEEVEIDHGDGVGRTRLVCIPWFSKTGTCAIVSLSTLSCQPVTFSTK